MASYFEAVMKDAGEYGFSHDKLWAMQSGGN